MTIEGTYTEEELRKLISHSMRKLPNDKRTLAYAEVLVADHITGSYVDYITAARARGSDEDNTTYMLYHERLLRPCPNSICAPVRTNARWCLWSPVLTWGSDLNRRFDSCPHVLVGAQLWLTWRDRCRACRERLRACVYIA